ncbi:uncharacterized membrane protein YgaE (UPF0421/DUF939 family) [Lysobacter niabensis]|uniref:Uncharacterized membrane protein YgaE (UPF0421/DUF939 family) n=1 Tax=Agrilutibacter niabensis TaxID=380628 RepID=A0ABU1VRQ5_9GAMM|nr:FUSC family protein [Lysobacter niabensis]MDR7099778.1 uncharacterized membrane protein YgaE (UPF0421/DUF939 family) [Lysobacter niabensis]
MTSAIPPADVQVPIRAAVAAALAVAAAQVLQLEYPLYALVSAVIVTDLSPSETRKLGLWRVAGTVLGAAIGATLSTFFPHGPVAIGIGVLAAMFLCHVLRLRGAAKVSGYVCGIVLLEYHMQPWVYAVHRLVETLLGIAVAVLVSLVPLLLSAGKNK